MDELAQSREAARRKLGGFLPHLVLAGWVLGVVLVGLARHRTVDELWTAWRGGDVPEQLEALQALIPRAELTDLAAELPAALLVAEDARLRELAFTNLFRHPRIRLTERDLVRIEDRHERFRAALWLHCQMRTPRRVTRADLDHWFANPPSPGP